MATINQVELAQRLFRQLVNINNSLVQNLSAYDAVIGEYNAQTAQEKAAIQAVALERFGVDWSELAALSSKLSAMSTTGTNQSLATVKNVF